MNRFIFIISSCVEINLVITSSIQNYTKQASKSPLLLDNLSCNREEIAEKIWKLHLCLWSVSLAIKRRKIGKERNLQGREKEEKKYRKAIWILPNQKLLAAKMRITAKGGRSSVRIDLSWFMWISLWLRGSPALCLQRRY